MKPESSIHRSKDFTVLIPGAAGAWGQKISQAATSLGWNVLPHDPGKIDPPIVTDIRDAASQADAVILCAPEEKIPGIFAECEDKLRPNTAIIDIATVKRTLIPLFERLETKGMSNCFTHPMVSALSDVRGHNVLLMPFGKTAEHALTIARQIFEVLEMRCTTRTRKEHDEVIAPVGQFFPHTTQQENGMVLANLVSLGISPFEIFDIGPANALFTQWGMGRSLMSPKTSANIIIEGLKTELGRKIIDLKRKALDTIIEAAENGTLESVLQRSMDILDPNIGTDKEQKHKWLDDMKTQTDQILGTHMRTRDTK